MWTLGYDIPLLGLNSILKIDQVTLGLVYFGLLMGGVPMLVYAQCGKM